MLVMFLILFLMTAGIANAGISNTATYVQTSKSCTIQAEGTAPEGSFATFETTSNTSIKKLLENESMTYTISKYDDKTIEAITLRMCSNQSTGIGGLSITIGTDTIAKLKGDTYFYQWFDAGGYTEYYKDIHVVFREGVDLEVGKNEDIVIKITCKVLNALFCESVSITWNHGSYSRDGLTADKFGTICLPKGGVVKSGATFFEIAYKDNNGVYMDEVTELVAGVPYVFQATDTKLVIAHDGTIATEPIHYNGLYGTFTEIQDVAATSDKTEYILANNQICECGSGCTVPANRAYLVLDEVPTTETPMQQGRRRVGMNVQGENQTTGLENTIVSTNEGIYDIMGRKVAEATASGFYIINGEKVFVVK